MPNEIKLMTASPSVKQWPVLLLLGIGVAVTGVLALVLLIASAQTAMLIVAAGIALTVWPVLRAANTEYFITNARVVSLTGLVGRKESSVAIRDIQDVRVSRTSFQETMGVGDVECQTAGGILRLEGVEEPEKLKEKILSLK